MAWGWDHSGQMGLGAGDVDHTSPASVPGLGPASEFGPARLLAAGDTHVLVAPAAGGLLAAGSNDFGQLGMGGNDTAARAALTSVPFFAGRTDIAQVTCRRTPPPSPTFPPTARPTVCPLLRDIMHDQAGGAGLQ